MLRGLPFQEIDRVLSLVRLDGQRKKKTSHYSLGMKQRLGLANALLGSPKLVLLDEPTNGLDPSGIHEMRELIKALPKQYGMTVMVSSHLLSEMEQTADHIAIIASGQLIFQDTLPVLQSRSLRQIHLRTSDDSRAAAFLNDYPAIHETNRPYVSTNESLLIPYLPDAILSHLLREMLKQGIDLYRIEEHSQSLEDIYLGMVKEAGL